jgi:MGT family glycosyltransferase
MGHALFVNVPMHAHINPTLPLVRELVARGERVRYYATPPFAPAIEASGATFVPYQAGDFSYYARPDGVLFNHAAVLMEATVALLPQLLEQAREWPVDYIVHDALCPWGRLLGTLLGVPTVSTTITFGFHPLVFVNAESLAYFFRTLLPGLPGLRRFRAAARLLTQRHGLPRPTMWQVVTNKAALNLVFTSRLVQPYVRLFDASYVFLGASADETAQDVAPLLSGAGDKPVVYISLGTSFNARPDFFRACLAACEGMPWHVVVSIGHRVDRAQLGSPPPNVVLATHVPQVALLEHAALFVSQGGMSSINESLLLGVPLLLYPQTVELAINARRIAALGAARRLTGSVLDATTLRRELVHMLADERPAQAARRLGQSYREAGGYRRGADQIERFKRDRGLS